jgi:hypothetical protein
MEEQKIPPREKVIPPQKPGEKPTSKVEKTMPKPQKSLTPAKPASPPLRAGKYRHYMGDFYELITIVLDSETEEELVLYKQLKPKDEFPEGQLWVRPKKNFSELLKANGKTVQRFEYIG